MEEVESLSSILGDTIFSKGEPDKPEPAPPADGPKGQPDAKTAESEVKADGDDHAEVKAPAEDKPEAKQEPKEDGRPVALAVARERYRKAEAALKELQARDVPAQKTSIFDNEDEGIAQRMNEATRPLRESNFNMSVKLARLTYKDQYETAEAAFFDSAEADPRLYQQLRAAADPGEFIFTVGTQIAELAPVGGDFMKYRDKVTGELKGELAKRDEQIKALSDQLEALKKSQTEIDSIPRSLNSSSSAPAPTAGDEDAEDINSIVRFKTG